MATPEELKIKTNLNFTKLSTLNPKPNENDDENENMPPG